MAAEGSGDARLLIVNADDFGRSAGVNAGVVRAHEQGIVTSASLMVRWPTAGEAAAWARGRSALGIGLHVDLGEWAMRDGAWAPVYEVVPLDEVAAVRGEVERQLEAFGRAVGRPPTHLDSHQHVHAKDPVVERVLKEVAERLGVPLRHFAPGIRYCGDFYGHTDEGQPIEGAISATALIDLVRALPGGTTELCCHPGLRADTGSPYDREREWEVEALCDPRVRAAIASEAIVLRPFGARGARPDTGRASAAGAQSAVYPSGGAEAPRGETS